MKKALIVAAGLILISSVAGAADLKGKFGVGVNWPGLQFRHGISNNLLVEGKVQLAVNNQTNLVIPVGGRVYYLFKEIPGNMAIIPYTGGEFDWIFSGVLSGGYLAGGFAGAELMLNKNISVGGDAGLYWVDVWYLTNPHASDYGLIFNAGLTYYF